MLVPQRIVGVHAVVIAVGGRDMVAKQKAIIERGLRKIWERVEKANERRIRERLTTQHAEVSVGVTIVWWLS